VHPAYIPSSQISIIGINPNPDINCLARPKVDRKPRKQSKPLFKLNLYKDLEDALDYIKTQVQKFQ